MKQKLILAALLMIFPACNCGGPRPCNQTADCGGGQICSAGTCVTGGNNDAGDGGPLGDGGADDAGGCVNYQCSQVTCPGGGTTSISGKIYDPAGSVPLYNVIVYVPNGQIQPFTPGVTCDRCGTVTSGSPLVLTVTSADGSFRLDNMPAGANIPLVIQIGRWRRQVTIPSVIACASNPITDVNLLRLPRSKSEGDIPQMAIATGNADPFECLLRKMGIADSEFTSPTGTGRIHYYVANGKNLPPPGAPAASTLWTDAGTLSNYDVVMLPCEGGENPKPAPANQNIIDYTAAGGRMFTTHYGYVWIAQPFAPQPFPSTGDWRPDRNQANNPPDPYFVTLDQSFPKGVAFAQWLINVGASQDAGYLTLHEARHNIWAVNNPPSQAWMYGNINGPLPDGGTFDAVPHLTFNTPINPPPAADGGTGAQCGRVVFSDFHVSAAALSGQPTFPASCLNGGLSSQEKALEFMLFDLSSCVQQDSPSCLALNDACSPLSSPCCSGFTCLDTAGRACQTTTGCTCHVIRLQ